MFDFGIVFNDEHESNTSAERNFDHEERLQMDRDVFNDLNENREKMKT